MKFFSAPTAVLKLCIAFVIAAPASAQVVSGVVYDAISEEPLQGASVKVADTETGVATDANGHYRMALPEAGRYNLQVSFVGYETRVVPDIWVRNGKITTQDFALNRSNTGLEEVVVRDKLNPAQIGALTITEEQINRHAATYYDPARLVTNSPDLAVSNDQNNRISVRGISPNFNVWRLEGAEIVNPNHLSNAGTFSDQSIATGGSVNIISAQMLGTSSFLYGGFSPRYGNTVGGLFDMNFRRGNREERQYTTQASLIGLDFAAEGPFSSTGEASYLVNYRYSFTGLLAAMGVDFGGEKIGFQDLSLNVSLPLKNKAELRVFAVGGLNFNNFNAASLAESEVEKDRSDIFYDGRMGAIGSSLKHSIGNGFATHSFALSSSHNTRNQSFYNDAQIDTAFYNTARTVSLGSLHSHYQFRTGPGELNFGVMANRYLYQNSVQTSLDASANSDVAQLLINPYAGATFPLASWLEADFGISTYFYPESAAALDPRLGLTYLPGRNLEFYTRLGSYSQLLNPYNYYFVQQASGGDYLAMGGQFTFQKSWRINTGVEYDWNNWNFGIEAFYYLFNDVNVTWANSSFITSAETKGISLIANRSYTRGWYLSGGGSLYNSTWSKAGEDVSNPYNTQYNLNFSSGKEWEINSASRKRSLSANVRVMYQGGLKNVGYHLGVPGSGDTEVLLWNDNADFFRLDLRLQWTWYRANKTSSLALDLQNATNYRNEAFRYGDSFTGNVETQYQLGLIPILTYRVEF